MLKIECDDQISFWVLYTSVSNLFYVGVSIRMNQETGFIFEVIQLFNFNSFRQQTYIKYYSISDLFFSSTRIYLDLDHLQYVKVNLILSDLNAKRIKIILKILEVV